MTFSFFLCFYSSVIRTFSFKFWIPSCGLDLVGSVPFILRILLWVPLDCETCQGFQLCACLASPNDTNHNTRPPWGISLPIYTGPTRLWPLIFHTGVVPRDSNSQLWYCVFYLYVYRRCCVRQKCLSDKTRCSSCVTAFLSYPKKLEIASH